MPDVGNSTWMGTPSSVTVARFVWLVLTSMMLVSRVLFQRRGAEGMRAFLDCWKDSRTKTVWGALSVAGALTVAVLAVTGHRLRATDVVVIILLVLVLGADGLVNVLPRGFHTFKDTVQSRWVARHAGTPAAGDHSMFGTINLGLAIAALAWSAVVALYRPIELTTLLAAVAWRSCSRRRSSPPPSRSEVGP